MKPPETNPDADAVICDCLNPTKPTSFFLFAGAGSGKTRSLVQGLDELRSTHGEWMKLRGQQVSVITYTNAARDEICRRLDFDSLFKVSTIHSFAWDLIQGFNQDIRSWLKDTLEEEISNLQEKIAKGKPTTRVYQERIRKSEAKSNRLKSLTSIKSFTYNPNGDNIDRDSLNHAEVMKLGAFFLDQKPLMRQILISRSPILLIDESQDTNKAFMDSLLRTQAANPDRFALGLIGDTMQRIYADGKADLGVNLPSTWKTPSKLVNHRCPKRVIQLINKIRSEDDGQQQVAPDSATEGFARLFITHSGKDNQEEVEERVRASMATHCNSPEWSDDRSVKALILEHHMASSRMGFMDMYAALDQISSFQTGLRDGSLPALRIFSELALPLLIAKRNHDDFTATAIVRKSSPLLQRAALKSDKSNQAQRIVAAREAVAALAKLCLDKNPTFRDVLNCISDHNLFQVPDKLLPYVNIDSSTSSQEEAEEDHESLSMNAFLASRFWQIEKYSDYTKSNSPFTTHQGVKGLEFPRVLVVIDDNSARGFLFSYEKLFGAAPESKKDTENAASGKETSIDRTRRLFYVTCSRSKHSLAILAYSSAPQAVAEYAVTRGWFDKDEIEII